MHGFLSRDGMPPREFLRVAREQLAQYPVELRALEAVDVARRDDGFCVVAADGTRHHCRKLLLATGLVDVLPDVEGMAELYGKGVHHCPYCDGWEVRDQPLAVYGRNEDGITLALHLLTWSRDVVLFTDGPCRLDAAEEAQLERHGVELRRERVVRLVGVNGHLAGVELENGEVVPRRALFLKLEQRQHSDLAQRLGITTTPSDGVATDAMERTATPGVWVAGDASRDVLLVAVAVAEGVKAAFAINTELQDEELA